MLQRFCFLPRVPHLVSTVQYSVRQSPQRFVLNKLVTVPLVRPSAFFSTAPSEMEQLKANPYYAKYASKLQQLQETSPEVFQSKLDELVAETSRRKQEADRMKAEQPAVANTHATTAPKTKTLDSVMKLELLHDKTADEIGQVWREFYKDKDCIYATIPSCDYEDMQNRCREFPNFLYPVPRGQGYEFFVQRWHGNECHMTPLRAYQALQDNAAACLTLIHYTDLASDKGIVLMMGVPDQKILSVYEAQLLALQVKMYYGVHSALKFNHVRAFNNAPHTFKHLELVREFENFKKDLSDKKLGEYTAT